MNRPEPSVAGRTGGHLAPLEVIRLYRSHDFSLNDFLATRAEVDPEREFLVYEGSSRSYAELRQEIAAAVLLLHQRGVRHGDRIGVFSANHPSTIVLLFALAHLGATMVPANPAYKPGELAYVLGHAGVTGLVAAPDIVAVAEEALATLDIKPWVMLNEPGPTAYQVLSDAASAMAGSGTLPSAAGTADSIALIIYTSGTTGFPKGVMHAQRGIVLTGEGFVGRMRLQPSDRLMCVLPMFHINALFYSVCGAIGAGGALVLVRRFTAAGFWQTVASTGATEINLVPAAANILLRRPRDEFVAGHTLHKMFVAPCTAQMIRSLTNEFAIGDIIECYGMTEIPGVFAVPFEGPRKIASMGVASPHPDPAHPRPQAKVLNDDGTEVPRGETGQLVVRTPTMMRGYYNAPEQTAAAIRDGWFHTGDLVYQDADGFFFYVGRIKDLIRRRGENISGAELDTVLASHPDVLEAAAIAVPSELGEDDILAAVVARPGSSITAEEIGAWMREHLSAVKSPRYVCFVKEFPHTPTQRVEKYKLRADKSLLAKAIDLEAAKPPKTAKSEV